MAYLLIFRLTRLRELYQVLYHNIRWGKKGDNYFMLYFSILINTSNFHKSNSTSVSAQRCPPGCLPIKIPSGCYFGVAQKTIFIKQYVLRRTMLQ
uniref:Uncharacterized protein n=1 Tax=Rhizophagus irregularis (strain DAOM 181602 / DAOM 197198 / MUCL 43194) TaxID=747089 RepID=U9UA96_RHIID